MCRCAWQHPQDALTEPATDKALLLAEEDRNDASGRYERRTMIARVMNLRWPVTGLGLLLGCLGFVAYLRCEAQNNLVPNHSFEIPDSCPGTHTFLALGEGPLGWFSGGATPDYFQSCVPPPNEASVPLHDYAFQYPQDGENYIGLVTYEWNSGGIREYAMVQLTEPLVLGQTYTVSFYANAAWNGTDSLFPQHYLASSHIGALFTMQPRPWTGGDPWTLATGYAHVYHPWIIADTVNWTLVSGTFVSDSAYQYLMVGNHYDNGITDTLHFGQYIWSPKAYTLIDNVCVSAGLEGCPLATSMVSRGESDALLFPNPTRHELSVNGLQEEVPIRILDATGRVVWNGRISKGSWHFDVSAWDRGCYVLDFFQGVRHRSFKFVLIE